MERQQPLTLEATPSGRWAVGREVSSALAIRSLLPLVGLLLPCAGCAIKQDGQNLVLTLPQPTAVWQWPADGPSKGEVAQVVPLWADGLVVHPDPMRNGLPTPGFAGRVYLFGQDMAEPLAADGMVSVHLYEGDTSKPKEVWNIPVAELQKVLKKDGLGWGYNLWLPWYTYRPEARKVTLVVQHRSKEGKDVWSGAAALAVNTGEGPSEVSVTKGQARTADELRKLKSEMLDKSQ